MMMPRARPKVGALHTVLPIDSIVDKFTMVTKALEPFSALSFSGPDLECLDPTARDSARQTFERALQALCDNIELTTFDVKRPYTKISGTLEPKTVVDGLLHRRNRLLEKRGLSEINTYVFLLNRSQAAATKLWPGFLEVGLHPLRFLQQKLSIKSKRERRQIELKRKVLELEEARTSFIQRFDDRFKIRLLDTTEIFQVLAEHLIPNEVKRPRGPISANFLDIQLASVHLEWHADHLAVDGDRVSVLSLRHPPANTCAGMLDEMRRIPGRWTAVSRIKRIPAEKARAELNARYRHLRSQAQRFTITSALKKGGDTPAESEVFRNVPIHSAIAELGDCERLIIGENRHLFEFSQKIIIWSRTEEAERATRQEFQRLFTRFDGQLIEERLGMLAEFLDTVAGNYCYGSRTMSLLDVNCADLMPVFGVDSGEERNEHLNAPCLTVVETNFGTPFHKNVHVGDTAGMLVFGRPGAGKTFLVLHLLLNAQKYLPFSYIFDLAGSYESLTKTLGGAYYRVSLERQPFSLNPFASPFTPDSWARLNQFASILIQRNGFSMNARQATELNEAIKNLYVLPPDMRQLSKLCAMLPRDLRGQLAPWIEDGPYARLFDNATDNLLLSDFQCFDFSALKSEPDALQAILFLTQMRIEDVVTHPDNRHRPKIMVSDETWWFVRDKNFESFYRDIVKRWRRYNGSLIFATQNSDDLTTSSICRALVENCPTKIFLASPDIDDQVYSSLFHLNSEELKQLRSLQPKKQFLFKQPHRAKVLNLYETREAYWLFTTNPYEAKRRDEMIAAHGFEKALEILAKE